LRRDRQKVKSGGERNGIRNCKGRTPTADFSHPTFHRTDHLALAMTERIADVAVAALDALRRGERAIKDQKESVRRISLELAKPGPHTVTIAIQRLPELILSR